MCEDPRELANAVFEESLGQTRKIPVDVFQIIRMFDAFYLFQDYSELEGAYVSDYDGGLAVIGINKNSIYERQRFTAAHELCHHLRDYDCSDPQVTSKEGINGESIDRTDNKKEWYANTFAAELLMPYKLFRNYAKRYLTDERYVCPDDAFNLCDIFGVSFESVMWNLHHHNFLSFSLTKDFFASYDTKNKSDRYRIKNLEPSYLADIVDSFQYLPRRDDSILWIRLKSLLVYNDSRIEGINISKDQAIRICTNIRLKGKDSEYFKEYHELDIIETVGLYLAYDELMNSGNITIDRYFIIEYNKKIFSLCPFAEVAGKYRGANARIAGSEVITADPSEIPEKMYLLGEDLKFLLDLISSQNLSISHIIERISPLHVRMTTIHPFEDGNGRTSRLVINAILKSIDWPPIYISLNQKSEYLEALKKADGGDYGPLNCFFMKRELESLMKLNGRLTLEYDP
jgi:Zn-dependent peptidase ImmA (M78 family)